MKTLVKIIGGLVVLTAITLVAISVLTREQRQIGKDFVLLASRGQFDAEHALFHPALQDAYPLDRMRAQFGAVEPYQEVTFTAVESDGSGTVLDGTARTASGCASQVHVEVLSGQITAFEVTPLCPAR